MHSHTVTPRFQSMDKETGVTIMEYIAMLSPTSKLRLLESGNYNNFALTKARRIQVSRH